MSETKILNNRLDAVERARVELQQQVKTLQQELSRSRSEATYYRGECRALADRGNAVRSIEETLTRRVDALKRDAMPGDRYAAAGVIEAQACLDIVRAIVGRGADRG